ncbi:MAG TPA: hypothetical protein VNM24_10305 [Burkholderiales bacterium]|nr:hypothetical protein [Burkholderiales bacterium]
MKRTVILTNASPDRFRAGERLLAELGKIFKRTFKKSRYQLTLLDFQNYSVPMEADLNALDQKIHQLVQLCQRLRKDNSELRQQLASARNENKRLAEKIGAARNRLEALLEQVPEGTE